MALDVAALIGAIPALVSAAQQLFSNLPKGERGKKRFEHVSGGLADLKKLLEDEDAVVRTAEELGMSEDDVEQVVAVWRRYWTANRIEDGVDALKKRQRVTRRRRR